MFYLVLWCHLSLTKTSARQSLVGGLCATSCGPPPPLKTCAKLRLTFIFLQLSTQKALTKTSQALVPFIIMHVARL